MFGSSAFGWLVGCCCCFLLIRLVECLFSVVCSDFGWFMILVNCSLVLYWLLFCSCLRVNCVGCYLWILCFVEYLSCGFLFGLYVLLGCDV